MQWLYLREVNQSLQISDAICSVFESLQISKRLKVSIDPKCKIGNLDLKKNPIICEVLLSSLLHI